MFLKPPFSWKEAGRGCTAMFFVIIEKTQRSGIPMENVSTILFAATLFGCPHYQPPSG